LFYSLMILCCIDANKLVLIEKYKWKMNCAPNVVRPSKLEALIFLHDIQVPLKCSNHVECWGKRQKNTAIISLISTLQL